VKTEYKKGKPKPPPPLAWKVEHPKAFVLGCDPTAFYTDQVGKKIPILFKTVFDIGGHDPRYFMSIRKNLIALDINSEADVYVQNLVTNFQPAETSKNKNWNVDALMSIPERKIEFDGVDSMCRIPVFLTSERLYKVLMNDDEPLLSASALYQEQDVLLPAEKNKLGRPLIALHRHPRYNHKSQEPYFKRVKEVLNIK
jgi:hypothetical protein